MSKGQTMFKGPWPTFNQEDGASMLPWEDTANATPLADLKEALEEIRANSVGLPDDDGASLGGVREFSTGAVRSSDVDHLRLDLITPIGLRAVAEAYRIGFEDEFLNDDLTARNWVGYARRSIYDALAGDWDALALAGVCLMEAARVEAGDDDAGEDNDLTTGWEHIPPAGLREVAKAYKEGEKYGDYNWEKGFPVSDLLNHALDHLNSWSIGDRDDPQIGKALFGVLGSIHSLAMWPNLNRDLRGPGCVPPRKGDAPAPEKYVVGATDQDVIPQPKGWPLSDTIEFAREIGLPVYVTGPIVLPKSQTALTKADMFDPEWVRAAVDFLCEEQAPQTPRPRHRIPAISDFLSGHKPAPVLYLSGPMTGIPAFNFPLFNETAKKLRDLGYPVLNPADFGADSGISWAKCLERDLAFMSHAHILVQLPGWDLSNGASLEYHNAVALGKGVVAVAELLGTA